MNRKQRRVEQALRRKGVDRAAAIIDALSYLAHVAAPTATGLTLILSSGEVIYLAAKTAQAMAATTPGVKRDVF